MEAIILEPVDKADSEKIKEFALINKIATSILNDEDNRFIERRKLQINNHAGIQKITSC